MNKSTENTNGVTGIVSEARILNPEIGNYEEHFINERFRYIVRLSNGRLEMSREIVQDYEIQPNSISKERIQRVADSFSNS
ncbi:MAG TPA: hypothetical protein DEF18_08635 [Muricauda sp.]|jgi:hypothetical protein|uniref:Uncharacterized protein n=2 Tax=Flagellimonas TaxID=444459 RepID=A0A1M6XJ95_9FLAO|nr:MULTISPECIES: hypothetical protein [Allomuricauda]MAU16722.1 hypothetical protein [Allomuricauda sp.]MBC73816.1 hypothetical protein [Allomuricauda sp.]MBO0353825.1 hypothetical protein [Allomuricauda aurea]SFB94441.1 hypothetical protein SAMN04487891_1046 [Allomuricauda taeanensis]SHL06021.1 hypothetical protein SAMN05216293_2597 [Allomuricauda taeanensis]|tara:strand:- start:9649 stop:9891 length:243 start_codon:yes stop_codon:yes gene_type:complete